MVYRNKVVIQGVILRRTCTALVVNQNVSDIYIVIQVVNQTVSCDISKECQEATVTRSHNSLVVVKATLVSLDIRPYNN